LSIICIIITTDSTRVLSENIIAGNTHGIVYGKLQV